MRLDDFVRNVDFIDRKVWVGRPPIERYYNDQFLPAIQAARGELAAPLSPMECFCGVVVNFMAQQPLKRMICVGRDPVLQSQFCAYNSMSNVNVIVATSGVSGLYSNILPGGFGWNNTIIGARSAAELARYIRPMFSFLTVVTGDTLEETFCFLNVCSKYLVGGGRLVLCGNTEHIEYVTKTFQSANILAPICKSKSICLGDNGECSVLTLTVRSIPELALHVA